MKRIFFYSILVLLFAGLSMTPGLAVAAPQISSVYGKLTEGDSVEVVGANFGSHQLKIEWLGGANGHIEKGANGEVFQKSKWVVKSEESYTLPRYTNKRSHSGSKSVHCDGGDSQTYNSLISYDAGSSFAGGEELFVSWWVYFDGGSGGQWKMFRLNHYLGWSDTSPEITMFNWNPGGYGQKQFVVRADRAETTYWLDEPSKEKAYPGRREWARVDLYLKMATSGSENGIAEIAIHRPNRQITTPYDPSNSRRWPYIRTGSNLRYFVWQNYFGNGLEGEVWMDDFYIQRGTRARVEIGDKSKWSNCTWREIQKPHEWSNKSITITFNRGIFSSGQTAYLYVVDSNGNVNSNGYPITIGAGSGGGGGGGGTTPPLESPKGLRIIQ